MTLGLAVLVAASLACAGPRRDATELPKVPHASGGPPPALGLGDPAQPAQTSEPRSPTASVVSDTPSAPPPSASATLPPTLAPTETVAASITPAPTSTPGPTATPAPLSDPLGDQIEALLGQLEATSNAAEAELNQIPENP